MPFPLRPVVKTVFLAERLPAIVLLVVTADAKRDREIISRLCPCPAARWVRRMGRDYIPPMIPVLVATRLRFQPIQIGLVLLVGAGYLGESAHD